MSASFSGCRRPLQSPGMSMLQRRSRPARLLLAALALGSPCTAPAAEGDPPFQAAKITLPSAQGEAADVSFVVRMDVQEQATVGVDKTPYWLFGAVGAMAVPLALLGSFAGLGVLAPIVAPPFNAAFNERREALVHAVSAEPLPAAVADALNERLRDAPRLGRLRLELELSRFGLAPKSEESLSLLETGEDLCLGARARVTVDGPQGTREHLVGVGGEFSGDRDAPRPVCASMARFAENDGLLLRQAIRELAEILAAMTLERLEAAP
jgi:hypothetical protein